MLQQPIYLRPSHSFTLQWPERYYINVTITRTFQNNFVLSLIREVGAHRNDILGLTRFLQVQPNYYNTLYKILYSHHSFPWGFGPLLCFMQLCGMLTVFLTELDKGRRDFSHLLSSLDTPKNVVGDGCWKLSTHRPSTPSMTTKMISGMIDNLSSRKAGHLLQLKFVGVSEVQPK